MSWVAIVPSVARDGHLSLGGANTEKLSRTLKVGGLGSRLSHHANGSSSRRETQVAENHLLHGDPSVDLRGT